MLDHRRYGAAVHRVQCLALTVAAGAHGPPVHANQIGDAFRLLRELPHMTARQPYTQADLESWFTAAATGGSPEPTPRGLMTMTTKDNPTAAAEQKAEAGTPTGLAGIHHVGLTVTDVERSVGWYREMLGMVQWGAETYPGGRSVILARPDTSLSLGLHVHKGTGGEVLAAHVTGLDHLSMTVTTRSELGDWYSHLVSHGVECSEIRASNDPAPHALFTFTDPDGIALELIHLDMDSSAASPE